MPTKVVLILAALLCLTLGALVHDGLHPAPAVAAWGPPTSAGHAQAYTHGQGSVQKGENGTLNTSSVVDVTGSASAYASAFEVVNDGTASLYVEANVSSVAAMTASSHEVKAGEVYQSPVRARYYTLYSPSTTTYRVRAAY